jgi:transmembrane sensor
MYDGHETTLMTPALPWERLHAYFTGAASDADRAAIDAWRAASAENATLFDAAHRVWLAAGPQHTFDAELAVDALHRRIRAAQGWRARRVGGGRPALLSNRSGGRLSDRLRGWPAAVAAAALLIVAGGLWYRVHTATAVAAQRAVGAEYVTTVGQRATVTLSDGTRVILAPASRLRLDPGFGVARRQLSLQGQGYFMVAPAADKPFVVRTSNVAAQALGTAFTIRQYPMERETRVAVTFGKVAVRDAAALSDAPITLLARGDMVRVPLDGARVVTHGIDVDDALAWTRGRLVFHNAPVAEVLAELRRWYNMDVYIADPQLSGKHVTLSVNNESPAALVRALALVLEANVEWYDNTAVLTPLE